MGNCIAGNHFPLRIMAFRGAASKRGNRYEHMTYDFSAMWVSCGTVVVKLIIERQEAATKREFPFRIGKFPVATALTSNRLTRIKDMKNLKKLFVAMILTLALSGAAFAGDISGGRSVSLQGDISGGRSLSVQGDISGGLRTSGDISGGFTFSIADYVLLVIAALG